MILDDIRTRYPSLGLAVFAMEPGQPVTIETYTPDGQVFSFSAGSVHAALAKAFPEMFEPDEPVEADPVEPATNVFD